MNAFQGQGHQGVHLKLVQEVVDVKETCMCTSGGNADGIFRVGKPLAKLHHAELGQGQHAQRRQFRVHPQVAAAGQVGEVPAGRG